MLVAQSGVMSWCMISSGERADEHTCHLVETLPHPHSDPSLDRPRADTQGASGHVPGKEICFQYAETFVSQSTKSCVLSD